MIPPLGTKRIPITMSWFDAHLIIGSRYFKASEYYDNLNCGVDEIEAEASELGLLQVCRQWIQRTGSPRPVNPTHPFIFSTARFFKAAKPIHVGD